MNSILINIVGVIILVTISLMVWAVFIWILWKLGMFK